MTPRVVAFIDHAAVLGGGEIALCNLIEQLDRTEWQPVVILGADGPLVTRLKRIGVTVDVVPMPSVLTKVRQQNIGLAALIHPVRLLAAVRYILRLARRLRQRHASVVHANSLRACVLAGLAARLARIPVVWQVHSVVAEPMMSRRAASMIRSLSGLLADRIICNSNATAMSFGNAVGRVRTIPCGIDASRYGANGRRGNPARVGMIARFSPIKGQAVFVEAANQVAAQHPDAEFVLAGAALFGEDAYAAGVRKAATSSASANQFRFLGFVDDVPALLHDLDVVVQPSIYPEGLGQSVLEAMMAGKPVVASAAGGLTELIDDGATGRLVAPGDASQLGKAISDLLSNPSLATEMGHRARERALAHYDIRETCRAVESVYAEVLH